MTKAKPTKTLNPLHFEDLDPHRFEDLVRNLIYDLKKWQTIESTGRGGSDDGYDIRAWETIISETNKDIDDSEDSDVGTYPMEGTLWKIQCKRESTVFPKQIETIVEEGVKPGEKIYGYILVAPTNFSKKSHDVFRKELIKKDVKEFYLWGKSELEDQLYMPKNDSILFTFFGISIQTKKRTRTSELRFAINNKNKLVRIFKSSEDREQMRDRVLFRDYLDENYPFEDAYTDFKDYPRWEEHLIEELHPRGVLVCARQYYAYINKETKEYDFIKDYDLLLNQKDTTYQLRHPNPEKIKQIEDMWKYQPLKNKGKLSIMGFIPYTELLLIDDKGDNHYKCPHIYTNFSLKTCHFKSIFHVLDLGNEKIDVEGKYKKISYFPKKLLKIRLKYLKGKEFEVSEQFEKSIKTGWDTKLLFDIDNRYADLNPHVIVKIKQKNPSLDGYDTELYIKILHKYVTNVGEFIKTNNYTKETFIKELEDGASKNVKVSDELTVLECERGSSWEIKNDY